MSILRYAGNGRWASQEDLYNAKEAEAVLAEYLTAAAGARASFDGELDRLLDGRE